MNTETLNDRLLSTNEAAELLGLPPQTLVSWRCTRTVRIPFVRIGRAVRYKRSAIETFIERSTVEDDTPDAAA